MSIYIKRYKRKVSLLVYFYMLLILMTLLTVASYTWFSISRTPRVSDMDMYINSQSGLQLAQDPAAEEWGLQLDFRDLVDETSPLRPVTWSDRRQCFYSARYFADGRLDAVSNWLPLSDERNANKNNLDGYYIKVSFYARSGVGTKVTLSPAVEVDEGVNGSGTYVIGTPIWDAQRVLHSNGGDGAECAVRIGIRVTPVDPTGAATGDQSKFFVYEPNSDGHLDGSTGYIATPSIDGTAGLVEDAYMIRQTSSTWSEAYPVERNVVIKSLGEFQDTPTLFHLSPDEMVRIDLYVWLEGQDVDCTNIIEEAQLVANIQFAGEPDNQSGLKPIE